MLNLISSTELREARMLGNPEHQSVLNLPCERAGTGWKFETRTGFQSKFTETSQRVRKINDILAPRASLINRDVPTAISQEVPMKTRLDPVVLGLAFAVLFVSGVSLAVAQAKSASNIIVFRNTVKIAGPNGANDQDAPPALQVLGGVGGQEVNQGPGNGGGILVQAGQGGESSGFGGTGGGVLVVAGVGGGGGNGGGTGGTIKLVAGSGGGSSEDPSGGGSIVIQPGAGSCTFLGCGVPGNVILDLPKTGSSRANFGIGTDSPSNTLEVVPGGTTLADAWTVRSSRRLKTNIQPLLGALEKVEQLQGVSYQRKSDGKREIGVVAEDVNMVVPEVVSHNPTTNEVQGVDYSRLAALLIEAVKSQQVEIRELKARIEQLTGNSTKE